MIARRIVWPVSLTAAIIAGAVYADEPRLLTADDFQELHQLITPQPGESRWMEIDWYPNIWEARQRAATEGKPLFLWAGSGGAPAAGC